MRIFPFLGIVAGFLCFASRPPASQQSSSSTDNPVEDAEQRTGPFTVAGLDYFVVLHDKRLTSVDAPAFARTLAGIEIKDADGNVSYQRGFPYAIEQGRFQRSLSASAQLASGNTGTGLVIYYREQTAASQTSAAQTSESWQLFGSVQGRLVSLGKPAPIGEGMTVGPFMGVMMRAANGSVSVIGQPDTIEVRAWAGNFYVFFPLRVDWNHSGLAQGQRCMEMLGGGLREVGCDMRVAANRKPPADEFTFIRLLPEAQEDPDAAQHLVVQKGSSVEILGSRAITSWNETGGLIQPVFSDVWLRVNVDGQQGWIHGEEDFAAVGLPAGSPAP
jgi:hypothetical protein